MLSLREGTDKKRNMQASVSKIEYAHKSFHTCGLSREKNVRARTPECRIAPPWYNVVATGPVFGPTCAQKSSRSPFKVGPGGHLLEVSRSKRYTIAKWELRVPARWNSNADSTRDGRVGMLTVNQISVHTYRWTCRKKKPNFPYRDQ